MARCEEPSEYSNVGAAAGLFLITLLLGCHVEERKTTRTIENAGSTTSTTTEAEQNAGTTNQVQVDNPFVAPNVALALAALDYRHVGKLTNVEPPHASIDADVGDAGTWTATLKNLPNSVKSLTDFTVKEDHLPRAYICALSRDLPSPLPVVPETMGTGTSQWKILANEPIGCPNVTLTGPLVFSPTADMRNLADPLTRINHYMLSLTSELMYPANPAARPQDYIVGMQDYFRSWGFQKIRSSYTTDGTAVVIAAAMTKAIVVTFQGTSSQASILSDLDYFLTPAAAFGFGPTAMIHRGMGESLLVLNKPSGTYKGLVEELAALGTDGTSSYFFTGHSRGAMALYIAAALSTKTSAKINVVTFGSPRLGNKAFADEFNKLVQSGRITNTNLVTAGDVVPNAPPTADALKAPTVMAFFAAIGPQIAAMFQQ